MRTENQAFFRFYAELNDFLHADKCGKTIEYSFWGKPAVKDAIEALGIPHPEVDLILVNSRSVDFKYRLNHLDRLSVYPVFELFDITPVTRLRPQPLRTPRFIADVNLGKLARNLRILGFSCLYRNDYTDMNIINTAAENSLIILTRDIGLLKHSLVTHGCWVRSTNHKEQTTEIVTKYDLFSRLKPFSICLKCNGNIKPAAKQKVADQLPEKAKKYYDNFYRCESCKQVYWQGSHYQNMIKFVKAIKQTVRV